MQLHEIVYSDAKPVDGYGPGFFRVGGERHDGPMLLLADRVAAWEGLEDIAPLKAVAGQADVVLFGMGVEMRPVPADLRQALEAAGLGVEPMSSPSACRSYNILVAEGRRVVLAALPV